MIEIKLADALYTLSALDQKFQSQMLTDLKWTRGEYIMLNYAICKCMEALHELACTPIED